MDAENCDVPADQGVVHLLQVSAAVALMGSPKADLGLRLNGAVLAGALIDGGETGARDFYDENGALWHLQLALLLDLDPQIQLEFELP
jgi:hypothetical protein